MRPQTCWIVYCINLTVKGRVLSLETLEVENNSFQEIDFVIQKNKKPIPR